MRLIFSVSAGVVLAALLLAACNSKDKSGTGSAGSTSSQSSARSQVPPDGVRRVTTVELRDALEKGTALVIDVRGDASYKQNHIKGSISIPVDQVADHIGELPRDKMIVAYCS